MNTNWFRERFLPPSKSSSRRGRPASCLNAYRPQLEALEDRTLLSAGALDPTFGNQGKVIVSGQSARQYKAVAIQPDGKIVVVGDIDTTSFTWLVERFLPDGTPDPNFGNNGVAQLVQFGGVYEVARAVALQPNGDIVVAGQGGGNVTSPTFWALARYLPNGRLDPNFGMNGALTFSQFTGIQDSANAVALDSAGRIVVVGKGDGTGGAFSLARLLPNGQPDGSFNGTGHVTTGFLGVANEDQAEGVVIQPNGEIVAAGQAGVSKGSNSLSLPDIALARYDDSGHLDLGFGPSGNGIVLTDFSSDLNTSDNATSVALEPDGGIVAAGSSVGPGTYTWAALARYSSNGVPDTSFHSTGKERFLLPEATVNPINSLAIQADGKIVAAGSTDSGTGDFALERFNPDGSIDATFGNAGQVSTDFPGGGEQAFGVALQADGKIVAVGTSSNNNVGSALARYENDHLQFSAPAYSVGENGGSAIITITRVGGVTGTVSAVVSTSNGSARAGANYLPVSTTVVFNPGETSKTISIPILPEAFADGNETVNLTLSSPSGAGIGNPGTAVLTIVDAAPFRPIDVTSQLAISLGKVRLDAATGKATQKVTIRNVGGEAVWGPLTLVLDGLKSKVKVRRRSGLTQHLAPLGSPFVSIVPDPADQLASQSQVVITMRFSDPLDLPIRYRPQVLAGFGAV
jgi:uncharacterized delta-60 repeat protein